MSPEIERYLRDRGIAFEVHRHPPIMTFDDAKATVPFDPGHMVKGLAFGLDDGRVAIVALRAQDRAHYKRVSDALGVRREDLRMATPDEIEGWLDMQVGAIAPIPIANAIVLVDRSVVDLDVVICGSGRRDASLELARAEFARIPVDQVGDFRR